MCPPFFTCCCTFICIIRLPFCFVHILPTFQLFFFPTFGSFGIHLRSRYLCCCMIHPFVRTGLATEAPPFINFVFSIQFRHTPLPSLMLGFIYISNTKPLRSPRQGATISSLVLRIPSHLPRFINVSYNSGRKGRRKPKRSSGSGRFGLGGTTSGQRVYVTSARDAHGKLKLRGNFY